VTVPGTPLPGSPIGAGTPLPGPLPLPAGSITRPWSVVPAHVVIHAGIFIGTLLTLLMHNIDDGMLKLVAGPPNGMHRAEWFTWLGVGIGSGPLMAISYWMARRGGKSRYASLWIHIIANFAGEAAILIYMYAANVVGGILPGWAFGWAIIVSVMVFMVWLLFNDTMRLRQLERLASKLQRVDTAARDHDEDMRDATEAHTRTHSAESEDG
jgi:hypothetical protein